MNVSSSKKYFSYGAEGRNENGLSKCLIENEDTVNHVPS